MASSAFDQCLVLDIRFLPFIPHRHDSDSNDSVWCKYTQAIDNDLHYLLKLTHKRFWTQVIYDESLSKLIDSYLQHAPRPHDSLSQMSTKAKDCLRSVHKRVFMTLLRLSTHQETQDLSVSLFSDLIYNNRIFTIPRILDMCSLYGQSNTEILSKMIGNVFEKQPKFKDDLTIAINRIAKEVFDDFTSKCSSMDDTSSIDPVLLKKMVKYFSDIVHSLKSLLSVFPPSKLTLWEAGLPDKLVTFFEANVPILKSQVKQSTNHDIECSPSLSNYLKQGIKDSCHLIHTLIMSGCGSGLVGGSELPSNADSLISLFNTMITDKIFLKDFERYFNVRNVLRKVQSSIPDFDEAQVDYILSAIGGSDDTEEHNGDVVKSKPRPVDGAKKDDMSIQHIQEILPHLEIEFIKECLKEFNGDPEIVIQRYLDGHLPPHLLSIANGTQQPLEEVPSAVTLGNGEPHLPVADLVDSRVGIYDYDEFDLMHNPNVDWSRIHKGKKHESARSILSDRSHVSLMKGRGLDLLPDYDEYDDEYDDTYDSQIVGATDQDSADELLPAAIQRLNEKGKFSSKQNWHTTTNEDNEPLVSSTQSSIPNIETPKPVVSILKRPDNQTTQTSKSQRKDQHHKGGGARVDIRVDDHKLTKTERKEQSQQLLEEKRGKHQQQHEKGGDGKTQVHRQHKERNKSSRANHNRKIASDKKRKAF